MLDQTISEFYDQNIGQIRPLAIKDHSEFKNLINSPSNGWCLLHSFQLVNLVDYSKPIELNEIKVRILNEFKNCASRIFSKNF